MPNPAACDWVDVPGARLFVRQAGTGTPLLLLHGWAMDHRLFQPQLGDLAQDFHVVVYDRRGCGRSTGRPDLAAAVDDLAAVADATVGDQPFHLLGMSQGGRVALRFAACRAERLRSLLLQGPGVDGLEPDGPDAERIPVERYAELARRGELDALHEAWLAHPLMRLEPGHDGAARLLRDMVADYRGVDLLHQPPVPRPSGEDAVQQLTALQLPTLLLTGAAETSARRQIARRLLELLPTARETVFEHSGHLANLTEPAAYNAAVREFCREVDAASSATRP